MLIASPITSQKIAEAIFDVVKMIFSSDLFEAFAIICMTMGVIGLVLCLIGLRKYS